MTLSLHAEIVIAVVLAWFWGAQSVVALAYQAEFAWTLGTAHGRRIRALTRTIRYADPGPELAEAIRSRAATRMNLAKTSVLVMVHVLFTAIAVLSIWGAGHVNRESFLGLVIARAIYITGTGVLIWCTWYSHRQFAVMAVESPSPGAAQGH